MRPEHGQLFWEDGCGTTNPLPCFFPSTQEAAVVFLALGDFSAADTFPDIFTYGKFSLPTNIYKHLDGLEKM